MDAAGPTHDAPTLGTVVQTLWSRRSLRHLAIGNMASVMAGASMFAWGPSYLIRHHGLQSAEVGLWMGLLTGAFGATGTLGAGLLTDRLAGASMRYYFWIPAASAVLSILPAVGFCLWPEGNQAIWFVGPFVLFTGMYLGPVSAITQTLLPQRMRALASAVLSSFTTLIGTGLGPQIVGIASDALAPRFSTKSVGIALLGLSILVFLWSGVHYTIGSRYVLSDLEAARSGR
jgi:hypothetical protein